VPTLLGAAGIDAVETANKMTSFRELHPLPGRDLMPVVDGAAADAGRTVYAMTRDNMPEGDSGVSGIARRLGWTKKLPPPLRIEVPAHVGANFEAIVSRVDGPGAGHLWKLVRTFDDPATWTEPHERHLASNGVGGETHRTEPLPDEWELYDLDADPREAKNRWNASEASEVFEVLKERLAAERIRAVPERHRPWPYARRAPTSGPRRKKPSVAARALRSLLQRIGNHPQDEVPVDVDLSGRRALVIATNHGELEIGKPTGVFASELTVPYYAFLGAGMVVDVASPRGGLIPVDPLSMNPVLRTPSCDRLLADEVLQAKLAASAAVGESNVEDYELVYCAGGWGAAFDLGFSEELGELITQADERGRIIGGVCHGPLGLLKARARDGSPLVAGRRVTAVTDKQVRELRIQSTPHHPETELRKLGARFESETRLFDPIANHWVVDGNRVTGQNQNAAPMVAREMLRLAAERLRGEVRT